MLPKVAKVLSILAAYNCPLQFSDHYGNKTSTATTATLGAMSLNHW